MYEKKNRFKAKIVDINEALGMFTFDLRQHSIADLIYGKIVKVNFD